jgi:predicted AAA+ superfamily ATPase
MINVVNVIERNDLLLKGITDIPGVCPHLDQLARSPVVFRVSFGLDSLPEEPGVILVRGARQYGKSTWLEAELRRTVEEHGAGSGLYLNGDEIRDAEELAERIRTLASLFAGKAPVRRLFIDEITAVKGWERGLKRVLDAGELRSVLVVTTGSKATDLRRGSERLPGRKGRLGRSSYIFAPLPYAEFERVAGDALGAGCLVAYLLSGGCPAACAEIATGRRIPEHVVTMIRDWMIGECSSTGRDRASLLAVVQTILARGGTPLGQARLAREAGLANNTVAAGYVELLADLLCVSICHAWDASRRVAVRRRPAKYHLTNLLAAVSWGASRMRTTDDFHSLDPGAQGRFAEWLVAQEIFRRRAVGGEEMPEQMLYYQSREREIDFVLDDGTFLEVKRGATSPMEFAWFPRSFPGSRLVVIGREGFEAGPIVGITLERFLRGDDPLS